MSQRTTFIVTAEGCDMQNPVSIDLTDDELAAVQRLTARLEQQSRVSCMPTLTVKRYESAAQWERDKADGKDD